MRLFLDTSVLLAAAASSRGASREIFRLAPGNKWVMITTGYVVEEVLRNLPDFPLLVSGEWVRLRSELWLALVTSCGVPSGDGGVDAIGRISSRAGQ